MHVPREIARRTLGGDRGQTMAEYAVVLGVITLAIVASYASLSNAIEGFFAEVAGLFS